MKLRQPKGVEMHNILIYFLICDGRQNDVPLLVFLFSFLLYLFRVLHFYVSKTMLLAFSFRGMPLVQGVCPGRD